MLSLKIKTFSLRLISILFIIRLSKIEDDIILSLVGKEIIEFSAQASQNEEFITVTDEDINCPDIVQAFNIMAVLNLNITHSMIEGGMYQGKVKAKDIMSVPTVYKGQEEFTSGRASIEQLVEKLDGPLDADAFADKGVYDVLIIGGGPAGNSAAIYATRKGLKTGLLAETFGGQVIETVGIENMIGTLYTEGTKLMDQVEEYTKSYDVDIIKSQLATGI